MFLKNILKNTCQRKCWISPTILCECNKRQLSVFVPITKNFVIVCQLTNKASTTNEKHRWSDFIVFCKKIGVVGLY